MNRLHALPFTWDHGGFIPFLHDKIESSWRCCPKLWCPNSFMTGIRFMLHCEVQYRNRQLYICIYIYTYIHIYVNISIYMCDVHTRIVMVRDTYSYAGIYQYIYIYIQEYNYIAIHTYIYIYAIYVCIYFASYYITSYHI